MTEPEVTDESLLSSLQALDRGESPEAPPEKVEPVEKPKEEAAEVKEEAKAPESDSSLIKQSTPEEKPKSKYEANKERQGKTWQEINAEKEAVKAEKAAILAEKQALEKEREEFKKARTDGEPYRDENGATAKDYKTIAKQYRAKGEEAMADAAEKLAEDLTVKEQQVKAQRAEADLRKKWEGSFSKLSSEKPDLKDPNSDLNKETLALLKRMPLLTQHPEGLEMAVAFAENATKGKSYERTTAELKELKDKYNALEKKLSVTSGPPTTPPKDGKAFAELSIKDQEKRLGQLAAEHDREAGF